MRHRKHHSRLSRQVGARTALLRNLAKALIEHERIETTTAKAKVLRPFVEGIVTLGKKGTQHDRRNAFSKLAHKSAVDKVFSVIAPRFATREGGYTRLIHSRRRMGDGAELAYVEFVDRVEKAEEEAAPAAPATK